jgi:hypothetical protein
MSDFSSKDKKTQAVENAKKATPTIKKGQGKQAGVKPEGRPEIRRFLRVPPRQGANAVRGQEKRSEPETPRDRVRAIFRERGLPEGLIPEDVTDFEFKPATGRLRLMLKDRVTRQLADEKDVMQTLRFEDVVEMSLFSREIYNIRGVTTPDRFNAPITNIRMTGKGEILLQRRVGLLDDTIKLKEVDLPVL